MPSIRLEKGNSLIEYVTTVEEASWHDLVHIEVLVLRESILASLWNFGCLLYVLQRISPDSPTWGSMLGTMWELLSPANRDLRLPRESRILLALIWLPLMLGVSAGARVLGLLGQHRSEWPETSSGMGKVKICVVALATTRELPPTIASLSFALIDGEGKDLPSGCLNIVCGVAADLTVYLASLGDPVAARMTMLFVTFGLQVLFLAASSIPFDCIGTIYLSGSQAPLLPTSMTMRDSLDEKEFDISPHRLVIDVDSMEERLIGDTY
ncbi:BQ5605_C021g09278 [Microbotryum silenes-dioicae]|uniref:BQ5605_C021g09278 protein n=1 Tax=Microbotryum silenes-dioicae TaxID=796604 RepID=A0A2X0MP07_9BASI|nr:BQ5605_C021g09278 [Microbotryum silenes-dioicae]